MVKNTRSFRHECKYEIDVFSYQTLRMRLSAMMERDSHALADGRYWIHSLYFDNCFDKALREKRDGINRREKFRLRRYNDDFHNLFLEKKQKINGLCLKTGCRIAPEVCERLLAEDPDWLPITFDRNIQSGLSGTDFLHPSPAAVSVMPSERMILEVKYDSFLPSFIADALQLGSIRMGAFSKYAACRAFF